MEDLREQGEEIVPHEPNHEPKEKRDMLLPGSILVAAIMISASLVYVTRSDDTANVSGSLSPAPPGPNVSLELTDRDVVLGDLNAPVTLIEYGDYQCSFCGKFFAEAEQKIKEEYVETGKVKMVFRNLQFLGDASIYAANAAECANDQGKFWEYHDALYSSQVLGGFRSNYSRGLILEIAGDLNLDTESFTSCIDSGKYEDLIREDTRSAQQLGVNSTPTSFVNGILITGARPFEDFQNVIEEELAKK